MEIAKQQAPRGTKLSRVADLLPVEAPVLVVQPTQPEPRTVVREQPKIKLAVEDVYTPVLVTNPAPFSKPSPESSEVIETRIDFVKKNQPPVANIFKKIGGAIKKVVGVGAAIASNFVPGVASKALTSVSSQLLGATLTPKPKTYSPGTLTPKSGTPTVTDVQELSGSSFTVAEKDKGLGAVLGLPDEGKINKTIWIVGGIVLGVVVLLFAFAKGGRGRR